jgi:hypothetical protein
MLAAPGWGQVTVGVLDMAGVMDPVYEKVGLLLTREHWMYLKMDYNQKGNINGR